MHKGCGCVAGRIELTASLLSEENSFFYTWTCSMDDMKSYSRRHIGIDSVVAVNSCDERKETPSVSTFLFFFLSSYMFFLSDFYASCLFFLPLSLAAVSLALFHPFPAVVLMLMLVLIIMLMSLLIIMLMSLYLAVKLVERLHTRTCPILSSFALSVLSHIQLSLFL